MATLGHSRIMRMLAIAASVVLVLTARVVLAAPEYQETAAVEIRDFTFVPRTLTVPVGTTITWTNYDEVIHTSTQDAGAWDSGDLGQGATFSFTFEEEGSFPYYCKPHGQPGGNGMAGTIVVTAAQVEPTETSAAEPVETITVEPTATIEEPTPTIAEPTATATEATAARTTATATTGTAEAAPEPPTGSGPSGATLAAIGMGALLALLAGVAVARRRRSRVIS